MNPILKKISSALPKEIKAGEKNTPPEAIPVADSDFGKFVNAVEKEFGKGSVIDSDSNGTILRVWLDRNAYTSNQKLFHAEEKQRWINGNGMLLLCIMDDVEPTSVRLFFTPEVQMGSEPKDDPRSTEKKPQKPVGTQY